jgi:hypothetical protein
MAKRARVSVEPSEVRYDMHLQDIHTPPKAALVENSVPNPNPEKCDSEVNSKQPDINSPDDTEKKDAVQESHGGPPPETSRKRKGFLSLGFLNMLF